MKTRTIFTLCTTAVALSLSTPSHAFLDKIIGTGGTTTESGNNEPKSDYQGVKHAIGVKDFKNEAGWRGQWELGNNLGLMLESALYDSGRFVVVSREKIDTVLAEQNLANSGRAAKSKVAQTGKIRSAKFIATGAIVEVQGGTQGSTGGINVKGFTIGGGGKKSTITAIITLIDSTTGEIVAKERVVGKAGGRKLRLGYRGNGWGTNMGGFAEEPIGQAAQDVINSAVDFLIDKMKDEKLDGAVAAIAGEKIIINRGTQYGVAVGDTFVVRTEGEEIIDPDSGEVLDKIEGEVVCTLEVTKVKEKVGYCKLVDGEKPAKGAVVVMN